MNTLLGLFECHQYSNSLVLAHCFSVTPRAMSIVDAEGCSLPTGDLEVLSEWEYFTCLASMSFLLSITTLNIHSHWIAATCNSWLQSLQERISFLLYQAPCIPSWVMPGFNSSYQLAFLVAQMVENLPATRDTWVWSLGWEDWATKTFINLVPRRGGGSISWRR